MLKLRNIPIIAIIILVLAACGSDTGSGNATNTEGKQVTYNLAHVLSENSSFHAAAAEFAKLVGEKTDGRIKIEIFAGGQLGGEAQSIQALRNGNQDFVITGTPALTATAPEFLGLDLPYIFNDLEEANSHLQGELGQEMLNLLDKYDIKGLAFNSVLERNVFSNKEIKEVSDLNNVKIRVVQSDGYVKAYEALGAQATPLPYAEVYVSLQQGVIEAGEGSAETMISDKFAEVSDFYNMTKTHYYPVILLASGNLFKGLSEADQKIIEDSAKEAVKVGIEFYKTEYDKSIKLMEEQGLKIVDSNREDFKNATEELRKNYLENNPNISPILKDIIEN